MSAESSENEPEGEAEGQAGLDNEIEQVMQEAAEAVDAARAARDDDEPEADDEPAVAPQEDVGERVEALQAEKDALRDKWLRAVADHENYKKRSKRDTDDAIQRALGKLLEDFLPVADNLDRAIGSLPDGTEDQLVQGLRMIETVFMNALSKHGITPIVSVGTPFDPAVHDALQQVDSPDHAPGVVMQEFERGYMRGERLLRPARVIVAGAGSTGAPPSEPSTSEDEAEA